MSKVKHIALIKFKEEASQEQIDKVFDDLLELSESIEGIEDYVAGDDFTKEGLNHGYTHGFIMSFQDRPARDSYMIHPEQERVKALVAPFFESVLVFDFEV